MGRMEIKDGRGYHKILDAKNNLERVRNWFKENPGSTIKECCNGLNLSYIPVRKHLNTLIEEQLSNKQ